MRTGLVDMDLGSWSFTPNALGEVVSQTDAKGQTTTFDYDALGRLTSRTEPGATSTWTWGGSAAAHNIGRLQAGGGMGYSESYTYDTLGRLSNRTINSDATYQFDVSCLSEASDRATACSRSLGRTTRSGWPGRRSMRRSAHGKLARRLRSSGTMCSRTPVMASTSFTRRCERRANARRLCRALQPDLPRGGTQLLRAESLRGAVNRIGARR